MKPNGGNEEQQEGLVNALGGEPPPGWGIHPIEAHLWDAPRYRIHPLTEKLEALGGIFHRLWPEHVEILRQMKMDGWPQDDIAEVAYTFRQRQDEEYEAHEAIIEGAKQQRLAQLEDDVAASHGIGVDPEEEMMQEQMMEEEEMGKSFQLLRKSSDNSEISMPAFPYAYDAFGPVFKESSLRHHYEVLHRKYVEMFEETLKGTAWEGLSPLSIMISLSQMPPGLVDKLIHYLGGDINHSFLWASIQPQERTEEEEEKNTSRASISDLLRNAIKDLFGSMEEMIASAKREANRLVGSGWLWLVYRGATDRLAMYTLRNHGNPQIMYDVGPDNPSIPGDIPLIGIDLWEHAYLAEYGPDKEAYVEDFFQIINWDVINQRLWQAKGFPDSDLLKSNTAEELLEEPEEDKDLSMQPLTIVHKSQLQEEKEKDGENEFPPLVFKMDKGMGQGDGGERRLSPQEAAVEREFDFSREATGVANASPTPSDDSQPLPSETNPPIYPAQ